MKIEKNNILRLEIFVFTTNLFQNAKLVYTKITLKLSFHVKHDVVYKILNIESTDEFIASL